MDSFISWIGGKKLLRKKVLEQFPDAGEYDRYIEVFGGAGWVLFSKEKHTPLEVFNDVNGELINPVGISYMFLFDIYNCIIMVYNN